MNVVSLLPSVTEIVSALGIEPVGVSHECDYVNRPGPRLVDTLEHLAGLIHPDRFETPEVARPVGELVAEP